MNRTNLQPPLLQFLLGGCPILLGSLKKARAQTRIYLKHEVAESAIATGAPGCITGWCPTLTFLLICSSLSGENGHPMQIYSLLSLVQIMGEDFRYPNGQHLPTTGSQEPSLGTAKAYMFSPHSTCTWDFKRFISQYVSMVRGGAKW